MNKKDTKEIDLGPGNQSAVSARGSLGLLALGAKGVLAWKEAMLNEKKSGGKEAQNEKQ